MGILRSSKLVPGKKPHVRVEFKLDVSDRNPIHHFFDAIDAIICWSVGKTGDIYEETSAGVGELRKRAQSVLTPPIDTHEIVYELDDGSKRVIPVLQVSALFPQQARRRTRR